MTTAAAELQRGVFAALTGDAALSGALGGAKVYDHAPANVAFPYVTFGRTALYDWSTGTETGNEHLFTLHVWSKAKGKDEAHQLMQLVKSALEDAPLELSGFVLVNLRHEFAEVRFDDDLAVYRGLLRFRAVTEPA